MKSKYCTCNIATYKPHCTYCGKQAYEANEGNYPPKTEKIEPSMKDKVCSRCNGVGSAYGTGLSKCSVCNGTSKTNPQI
jgi:hypothetical protein